jgi:hypothetical protein
MDSIMDSDVMNDDLSNSDSDDEDVEYRINGIFIVLLVL